MEGKGYFIGSCELFLGPEMIGIRMTFLENIKLVAYFN